MTINDQIALLKDGITSEIEKPSEEENEIISKRTATSKTFNIGKDRKNLKIFARPIHYKEDGIFKDEELVVQKINPEEYIIKKASYSAIFNKDKPYNYKILSGNNYITFSALFEESKNLKIQVDAWPTKVKETITLLNKEAPVKFQWNINSNNPENIIKLEAPFAVDAKGKNVSVTSSLIDKILTYTLDISNAVYPIILDPTSVITSNDGTPAKGAATYAGARDATDGVSLEVRWIVGQLFSGGNYFVRRAFGSFAIPDIVSISACSLFLEGFADDSTTDFEIYINEATPSTPLVKKDYDQFDGHQASGAYNGTVLNNTWNSSSYSATWNEIVFNAAGKSAILAKKNDTFSLVALSKEDYNNSAPPNSEYVTFNQSSISGSEPYLSITFTAPPEALAASINSVLSSSLKTIGNRGLKSSIDSALSASLVVTFFKVLQASMDTTLTTTDKVNISRGLKAEIDSSLSSEMLMKTIRGLKAEIDCILSINPNTLTNNLIGRWRLAEDSYVGGVYEDDGSGGNDGTPADTPVFGEDQNERSNAVTVFDGVYVGGDNLAEIGSGGTVVDTSSPWAVSLWLKNNGTLDTTFLVSLPKDDSGGWTTTCMALQLYTGAPNKLQLIVRKDDGSTQINTGVTTTQMIDGIEHHIIGQYTGTHLEIWVDDIREVNYDLAGQTLYQGTGSFGINYVRGGGSSNFKGSIWDVRVYNRKLLYPEIHLLNAYSPTMINAVRGFLATSNSSLSASQKMAAVRGLIGLSESEIHARLFLNKGDTPTNEMLTGF